MTAKYESNLVNLIKDVRAAAVVEASNAKVDVEPEGDGEPVQQRR